MYLIVGLGNPEEDYANTRHNMGFNTVNKLAREYNIEINKRKFKGLYGTGIIENEKVLILKPQTFMNLSGESIREAIDFYKLEEKDLIIIYDDIDIKPGTIKIRKTGGPGTHNGMKSVIQNLNKKEFARVRVGIGMPEHKGDLINYVIGSIPEEEKQILNEATTKAKEAVVEIIKNGVDNAMNKNELRRETLKTNQNKRKVKMTELYIQEQEKNKQIALVEDGKLVEYYEEDGESNRKEGNIYIGIVKDIIKGMQSAFVDIGTEKNSFIHLKDILPKIDETKETQDETIEITKLIKPKQKLLVQVKKDSNDKKGARVSTHINLPSKYIVLMPNTDIITVSQKIEDKEEQERLKKLVKENLSEGNGAVIRTSAQGKEKEIIKDIKEIESKWNKIIQTSIDPNLEEPKLLYKSEDIVEKMLMDLTEKKIKIEKGNNIFEKHDLNKQIEKSQNRKVWLKCGGFITIDKTEALTAIDVNTGKYTGNQNMQQTIFKVNKEATIEIAKQLRLRDIGGIVIIDYIDMQKKEDRKYIENLLKEELKKDRTKTQVEGFTKLDLMEMTRKHICSHKE